MTTYMILDLNVARLQERVEESYTITNCFYLQDDSDIVHLTVFDAHKLVFQYSSDVSVLQDARDDNMLLIIYELFDEVEMQADAASINQATYDYLYEHDDHVELSEYMCEVFLSEQAQQYNMLKS